MRHSDSFGDPRTAARQVVEDSRAGLYHLRSHWSDSVCTLADRAVSDLSYPTHVHFWHRHTADQPLTSRRLREGR